MGVKLLHCLERLVAEVAAALPGFHRRVLPGETDGAHPSAWNRLSSFPITAVVKVQEEAGSLLTFQTPRLTSSFHQKLLEVPLQTPIE